jgi:hypothetical protein
VLPFVVGRRGTTDASACRDHQDARLELHERGTQVSVPSGRTAEDIKPDVVALAHAILAKLP